MVKLFMQREYVFVCVHVCVHACAAEQMNQKCVPDFPGGQGH